MIQSTPRAAAAAPQAGATRLSDSLAGSLAGSLARWFDSGRGYAVTARENPPDRIDWARILPFVLMHVACLGVFWVGISPIALVVAAIAYLVRMFAITGFYHRYFSHRAFK